MDISRILVALSWARKYQKLQAEQSNRMVWGDRKLLVDFVVGPIGGWLHTLALA